MPEKAAQQILPALHGVGGATCSMGQSVKIKGRVVRERIGFQIGPQVLDGVEFGGVRWEIFQVCRTRQRAFGDQLALVGLEAIPDEDDGRVQLMLQMFEEVQARIRRGKRGLLSGARRFFYSRPVLLDPGTDALLIALDGASCRLLG